MRPEERWRVIEVLSTKWAEEYINRYKVGPDMADHYLNDPIQGVKFLLDRGFARAGGQQAGYGRIAFQALQASIEEYRSYSNLMSMEEAPDIVWREFKKLCHEHEMKPNENSNEGAIKGIIELARISEEYNPFRYFESNLSENTLEVYVFLVSFRGIGEKAASLILRDAVSVLSLEQEIRKHAPTNQILLQPIDRWVQTITTCLWDDFRKFQSKLGNYPHVIALRIINECWKFAEERGGCSPVSFNQGAWMYSSHVIKKTKETCNLIRKLTR